MHRQCLLDAFETNDVERIKEQLARYAEVEQKVALQVKARELLAELLASDPRAFTEIRETIQEFRRQLLRKPSSPAVSVNLRQDVPEPAFVIPPAPAPPFSTPVPTPSDSEVDDDAEHAFLVLKIRNRTSGEEMYGRIVRGHSRRDALLYAVKDSDVTVEDDIARDRDGFVYKVPDAAANGWMRLRPHEKK